MNVDGRTAYVQWVATDDEFRGRGCARAVMTTLLDWLDAHDVTAVELHATPMGEPLYRSLGFWEGAGSPPLRRRRWDPPPVR
jgi:ribosomal protein S18 acetylase RimI-like enzyme